MESNFINSCITEDTKTEQSSNKKQKCKSRKIRCIQDFDTLMNRSSLLGFSQNINLLDNVKSKKQYKLDFLPEVHLNDENSKETTQQILNNSSYKKTKPVQSIKKMSQAKFVNENDKCNSILSLSTDDEVDFKLQHQKKHHKTSEKQAVNTKLNHTKTSRKLEYFNKQSLEPRKSVKNLISTSFKLLSSPITPDTSGNNQGLFNVTYPIEEEYIHLSDDQLRLTFEGTKKDFQFKDSNEILKSKSAQKISMCTQGSKQSILNNSATTSDKYCDSIVNLITPSPTKSLSHFEKTLSTPTPTKNTPISTKNLKTSEMTNKSLVKSGTFIKENSTETKMNSSQVSNPGTYLNKSSRKRWTKLLGVSILDNSGNFQPISAPASTDFLLDSPGNTVSSDKYAPKDNTSSPNHLATSTPVPSNKNFDLFKKSKTKNMGIPIISKVKMPNFSKIHQKAYDKLENIKEMSERKAARAQKLLSGHKPEIGSIKKSATKSRKALIYNSIEENSKCHKMEMKLQVVKPLQKVDYKKHNTKLITREINNLQGKSAIPISNNRRMVIIEKRMNTKKKSLENKDAQKPKINEPKLLIKKGVFETDQLKAMVNKKPIPTDSLEKRRKNLQNVRTNRRFELLMQMRKK